jgi:hypothetical protein
MSIPLVKLGYLLVRTLAKPIAKTLQNQTAQHPAFRKLFIQFAQLYHRTEVRLRTKVNNGSGSQPQEGADGQSIKPWSEEKAIQFGANFIGEFVVFSIAGIVLVIESVRSSVSERRKQEERDAKIDTLQRDVEKLKEILALDSKSGTNIETKKT